MASEHEPAEARPAAASRRRSRHARHRIGIWLAAGLGAPLVRALAATWRPVTDGEEHVRAARGAGRGYFMAFWHGRMLVPAVHHGGQNYHALISSSGDGDVGSALLERIGYGLVRGSSGREGRQALRGMLQVLRAGDPIAVTPDGPRGPRHAITQGLAWLSRATGAPIVPCGFVAARAWHLPSWDRFTIPLPFARIAFVYGEPLHVPADAAPDQLEAFSAEIRDRILRAERRGFELLGVEGDG